VILIVIQFWFKEYFRALSGVDDNRVKFNEESKFVGNCNCSITTKEDIEDNPLLFADFHRFCRVQLIEF